MIKWSKFIQTLVLVFNILLVFGQNPIIRDQFTADPTARVFGDSVYLYPSHDIVAKEGQGRPGWFCMEDYHVFSSVNLTEWTDRGVIVTQNKVPWVKPDSYSMWAPDCIFRNEKYYFYFPAPAADTNYGRGFSIGVAIADKPTGPFIPESTPIIGVHGIDPCTFIDKDGQAYLYWSARNIYVAKLKDNMKELDSEPLIIPNLPEQGLKEGPFVFERNGIYYLTYPHVQNKTERLEYATGLSPMGPFEVKGVIMEESPNCWTNHQSITNYKGQWYLFYHQNDFSPNFDKRRSTRIDSLFFNDDGTIVEVIPTLRGVGITKATENIQIDRYSKISEKGTEVMLIDTSDTFKGWKTVFNSENAWIQYNAVDFGHKKLKTVVLKALTTKEAHIQIRIDKLDGSVISEIIIPASGNWTTVNANINAFEKGTHNIYLVANSNTLVEIDWIAFE
jgi:hypothetical protein